MNTIRQLTPLGVRKRQTVQQALDLLGRGLSSDLDAAANFLAVADVVRDTGWLAKWQKVNIPDTCYVVVNDEQVTTGYNGQWPASMQIDGIIRAGFFNIHTGELTVNTKAGGTFGSQPCKIKLRLTAQVRQNIKALRRTLDAEKLEAAIKADVLVVATNFEAWFAEHTVEEVLDLQEKGEIPGTDALEISAPEDYDWTLSVGSASISSLVHSKVVNEGTAAVKRKQQARVAALDGLANGIGKIQPGRPGALKAMLEAVAAELSGGNITAEEAEGFRAQAQEAEDKRLHVEAEDKAAKAEGKLAAMIAVADDPEKFAALHTAIGDVVDTIGDQKALQLSGEARVAFGTWFRAQIKGAQVPDDFNRLDALVSEYAAYLAEEDAQQLPGMIEAEFILKKEAAERRQAQRLAAKTSGIQSGAEGLAAIIKNPPPDVLAIANALETNRALVAAAHLAQHTDQAERMVKAYTQGQLAGHNGAVPALPALGNIDALLGQAPSEQEQIDALLLKMETEVPAITGKR